MPFSFSPVTLNSGKPVTARLLIQPAAFGVLLGSYFGGVPACPAQAGALRDSVKAVHRASDTLVYLLPFEVLITAPRMTIPLRESPAGTSIVGRDVLRDSPRGVAVDEALAFVPGIKVDNQANGARVHMSIRGQGILTESGIRSIKVLLDEIPVNDPTGLAPDFFDVDLNTVERIEVLKGPSSALYGGGAAGGIVNIVTQNSRKTPLFGDFSTVAGSNSFWRGSGQFGGDVNDVNYRVSFSRATGAGYRVHTHFSQNNLYAKATFTPGPDFQVTPVFSWVNTYHENPEGLSLEQYMRDPTLPNDDAIPYNEHMEVNRTTSGVAGIARVAARHEIRFNGYVKHSIGVEANNHVFDNQRLLAPGMSLQYTFASGSPEDRFRNHIGLGTDVQWQTSDEEVRPNDRAIESGQVLARQRVWQRGGGIFLFDRFDIARVWYVTGSVRLDRIRNELTDLMKTDTTDNSGGADFSNVTGRVGVTFAPADDVTLFGAWGEGFIPPSTEELGTNPAGYGGFNKSLSPALSRSFEAGVRGSPGKILVYDFTAFFLKTSGDFDRYRIPGRGNGKEGTFYRNIGRSTRYGVELSAESRPPGPIVVRVAYTFSHFTYGLDRPIPVLMDDTTAGKKILDGNWLPNSPQHRFVIGARCDIGENFTFDVRSETNSKAYIDGANVESESVQGYTLLGARVSVRMKMAGIGGELSLQVRNLADVKYVAFSEPDPGGNSYQPGPGREFFLGLSLQL